MVCARSDLFDQLILFLLAFHLRSRPEFCERTSIYLLLDVRYNFATVFLILFWKHEHAKIFQYVPHDLTTKGFILKKLYNIFAKTIMLVKMLNYLKNSLFGDLDQCGSLESAKCNYALLAPLTTSNAIFA